MNRRFFPILALVCLGTTWQAARADDGRHISPERVDLLDQRGVFPPAFKADIHALAEAVQGISDAQAQQKKLELQLPGLVDQQQKADAEVASLREELAKYDHPEEVDFAILQTTLKDPAAKPEEQMALAQAYVWTYPASPHAAEAQQALQQMQKAIADQQQATKDAEAAREAARAQLVQRAEAKDLTLDEWRGFLNGMSQEDVLKYLGRPDSQQDDYWIYSGGWIKDSSGGPKAGLEINFSGGRVLNVSKAP